jgi:hypothetical protein
MRKHGHLLLAALSLAFVGAYALRAWLHRDLWAWRVW